MIRVGKGLADVVGLLQQRSTFAHKAMGIVAKPLLHFFETVDKRRFIAILQQRNRLSETQVIALDQSQVIAG